MFTPLRIITGYSFLQSGLTMEKVKKALASPDYFGAGISDIHFLYGIPGFVGAMEENKKPFILGLAFQLNGQDVVAYAKDESGYRNLCLLSAKLSQDELTEDYLLAHHQGLLGVLETNYGQYKEKLVSGDGTLPRFTNSISKWFDAFYLGVEIKDKEEMDYAQKVREFADKYTYETVAFPRIRYDKKENAIVLKIVEAIRHDEQITEKTGEGMEYFLPLSEYEKIYTEKEIELTNEIVRSSTFQYHQKRGEMLHYPVKNSEEYLKTLVYDSLKKKGLDNDTYLRRAEYELSVIFQMGYADYFLIVQDYVNYAKTHDILVGSGRGSAAGSLVSYALNITEVDPLTYDLQFERFLNIGRKTMPDIDVDFMDTKRDEMVQYMRDKYGKEKVANIVTFQTILAKQALRDIGRIYNYPTRFIDSLSKTLTNKDYNLHDSYRNLPSFRKLVDSDKYFLEIVSLASKIENLPRQSGLHAAGIILNNKPIYESLPAALDYEDNYIGQYEMNYLEEQGFLKMDFLSLSNLTIIDAVLKSIRHNRNIELKYESIPIDDPEIFKLISSLQTMGIFQLESSGMKRAIKTLKPRNFDDVVALLALFRPGPMENIPSYARRRDHLEKPYYVSKAVEQVLSSTYGIIIYQEQINQLATVMAGFSLSEADSFRRAISKKKKEELASLEEKFIEGSVHNGYSKAEAENTFKLIDKFASYGFNKSHSVGYSYIACRMAYLKAYYPLEFYGAILSYSSSTKDSKFNEYVSEMKARNLQLLPPDINESTSVFFAKEKGLLFPLSAVHGLGLAMVESIIREREKKPFSDFINFVVRMYPYKISEAQISSLIDAGAFDCFGSTRSSLSLSLKMVLQYAELCYQEDGQMALDETFIPKPNLFTEADDPLEKLDKEYEAIGIMLSSNPLHYKKDLLLAKHVTPILEAHDVNYPTIAGIIKSKKTINTKKGTPMAFLKLFDETGEIEMVVFPNLYQEVFTILEKNNIIVVQGRFDLRNEDESFVADKIELLEE